MKYLFDFFRDFQQNLEQLQTDVSKWEIHLIGNLMKAFVIQISVENFLVTYWVIWPIATWF